MYTNLRPMFYYKVLSDEEKRSLYDRYGEAGVRGEYDGSGAGSQEVDTFDVFRSFLRIQMDMKKSDGAEEKFKEISAAYEDCILYVLEDLNCMYLSSFMLESHQTLQNKQD